MRKQKFGDLQNIWLQDLMMRKVSSMNEADLEMKKSRAGKGANRKERREEEEVELLVEFSSIIIVLIVPSTGK